MHEGGGGDLDHGMFTVYQVQMASIKFSPAYRVVVSYYPFAGREWVTPLAQTLLEVKRPSNGQSGVVEPIPRPGDLPVRVLMSSRPVRGRPCDRHITVLVW